ncbi:glucosaminidase domain-containing protein [Fructilactobacillus frigidiflavus]|uniref:glucosaminidase domain-containing protein n=1 Tax=Fructilactobacillus frigidiflavus TaxID=3242688 RepID=UPI003757FD01
MNYMEDKFTKAHNRMAMATGETKTRTKLSKSKHGWIKIAMGITFASTSLFLMSAPTFADETTPTTTNQTATVAQPEAQPADQNNNNNQASQGDATKEANNDVLTLAAQPQKQADNDNSAAANAQAAPQATDDAAQPASDNKAADTNQAAQATQFTAQSVTYTANQSQAIRDGASLESNVVNTLDPGESVNYDSTTNNEGYEWLHYISYSGDPHYVAKLNDDAPAAANNPTSSYISPDHQAFINQLAPGAQDTWDEYGVLPSVSIAQAIVESAWGQSAPGNNLYGIKGDYNGNSTLQNTQEYYNGHYVTIQDRFRAYPDFATSIEDHGRFLAVNSRYANLLYNQDYNYVCQMLQADGYATDPNYSNTLTSIISYNNLNRFDTTLGQPSQPVENNTNNNVPSPATDDNQAASDSTTTPATDNSQAANDTTPAPADNNNSAATNVTPESNPVVNNGVQITPASGAYTANQTQPVRTGASTTASVAATLDPGDTIYYDGTANNDGYNWMHYISYSGEAHWVADVNDVKQAQPAPAPVLQRKHQVLIA